MAGGKKIRKLAHSGDSVVLHSSRIEVLHLQSILYVHLRAYVSTKERLCRRPFRPMADYALARASAAAKLTAELHAQARQNGRVLDDFAFRIGGSETLKVEADLDKFILRPEFKGWKVFFETWPHDILLRTNMATSVWQDMPAMVAFRDASLLDKDRAGIPASEFLANLEDEPDTASFRWGLTISDSLRMMLQLQSLPESSTYLCGKPALRK
jgi:hypothetical protein